MRHGLSAILVAGALLLGCGLAGAAPFSVQVGGDRVVLDAPPGFADSAGFGSPRLTELAENLADPSSRVLTLALSDADARRFSAGDSLELRRYLLVVTPRSKERERINVAQFGKLVEDLERNFDPAFTSPENYRTDLAGRPPGQTHLLAKLKRDPQMVSLLYGTMVPQPAPNFWTADKPPLFKLSTSTLALIGGKALYISAFSAYDSPADVFWIRGITESWVEELRRLNR